MVLKLFEGTAMRTWQLFHLHSKVTKGAGRVERLNGSIIVWEDENLKNRQRIDKMLSGRHLVPSVSPKMQCNIMSIFMTITLGAQLT